jgi:hypothetical protein
MHGRVELPTAAVSGPAPHESALFRGLTSGQVCALSAFAGAAVLAFWLAPFALGRAILYVLWAGFAAASAWRIILCLASLRRPPSSPQPDRWPRYTILAALHDEAEVAPLLIESLSQIDYPPDRLEGFLVLEAHDETTLGAVSALPLPAWLQIHIVPPGGPCTKPRALNHALSRATGELVTIYDAEDDPDPLQLREAASRFMTEPDLVAVQAPLRIRRRGKSPSTFVDRQFAAEYAGLFEVALPGMAALGLPFPLGGTSNHLRADALKAVGGWDPYNVTEDADLGFRLWRRGGRLGVISRPTYETPPDGLHAWLPQRTRWLKGFLQTLGVHTRRLEGLGVRGVFSLAATLGMTVTSALLHGPALAWLGAALLVPVMAGVSPLVPLEAMAVLAIGSGAAWLTCKLGAVRAGAPYGLGDMLQAPLYWALTSLAVAHALVRLATEPHAWDKTPHRADVEPVLPALPSDAGRQAA